MKLRDVHDLESRERFMSRLHVTNDGFDLLLQKLSGVTAGLEKSGAKRTTGCVGSLSEWLLL